MMRIVTARRRPVVSLRLRHLSASRLYQSIRPSIRNGPTNEPAYSTVTVFARFLGLSIVHPRLRATEYARSWKRTLTGTG